MQMECADLYKEYLKSCARDGHIHLSYARFCQLAPYISEIAHNAVDAAVIAEQQRVWNSITRRALGFEWDSNKWEELLDLREELFPDGEPQPLNPPVWELRDD